MASTYTTEFERRTVVSLPPVSGTAAIMIGSGFTKALNPAALVWPDLINGLRKKLDRKRTLLGRKADLMVEAYRLSRRHSLNRRTALPTIFQNAVVSILDPYRVRGMSDPTVVANRSALATALRSLIDALRCRIIIDLNYDDSVEEVLREAGCRYVRWIGSEATWSGMPPLDSIRLWKIHGTIDQPATVVLSPTEYQRLYEVNEIGDQLGRLGSHLSSIWTLGVGLQEDDVWLHLCREKHPFDIVALWMTGGSTPDRSIAGWHSLVANRGRTVTVLKSDFAASNGQPALAERIAGLAREVTTRTGPAGRNESRSGRIEGFDKAYTDARSNDHDIAPIVRKYRNDYFSLREHFLSHSATSFGPRWCPSIDRNAHSMKIDDATLDLLARDFTSVIRAADESCASHENSVMIASAAQAATVHVMELATLLGIEASTELDWKSIDLKQDKARKPQLRISKGVSFLVGGNPFIVRGHDDYNPMHVTTINEDIRLGPPLIGDFDERNPPEDADQLLTEDEWEACVIYLYGWASPRIRLGKYEYVPKALPPLYPCGFLLMDLRVLRRHNLNGVSKYWHLVDTFMTTGDRSAKAAVSGTGVRQRSRSALADHCESENMMSSLRRPSGSKAKSLQPKLRLARAIRPPRKKNSQWLAKHPDG